MSSHGEKESKSRLNKLDQRGRQLLSEHQNHPYSCWGKGGCGVYRVWHFICTTHSIISIKGKGT